MANNSDSPHRPRENSLAIVEQKLSEELGKEPEETLLVEENEQKPLYRIRTDPTGFYVVKVKNSIDLEDYRWRVNKGGAKTLLDEETPTVEYGAIFRYSFEDEKFVPYSD